MNVTFHTITSLSFSVLVSKKISPATNKYFLKSDTKYFLILLFINILVHGLLDIMPHNYPLNSILDVSLSLAFFLMTIFIVTKRFHLTIMMSFFFAVLPDIIDIAPKLLNKYLNTNLLVFNLFPWHYPQYSGSMYNGQYSLFSLINHSIVLAFFIVVVVINRNYLRNTVLKSKTRYVT